jgi:cytosine/adenosine deaminase-related metal-dependent hydrolase
MRELLERVGAWQAGIFGDQTTLSAYLHQLQSAHRSLVIHGNFLTQDEIELLGQQRQRMSVIYCPRTHAACGHPPYPLAAMLSAGVRVALGTDSRATNPDLSLLRELRFAAARHPQTHPGELLRAATLSAAEALGLDKDIGSLTPGKRADLIVVPIETAPRAEPHQALLAGDQPVAAVLRAGRVVFTADNWRSAFAESLARQSPRDGP